MQYLFVRSSHTSPQYLGMSEKENARWISLQKGPNTDTYMSCCVVHVYVILDVCMLIKNVPEIQ